jgi:putative selenate reductase molybdopterin-binding subunit
MMLNSDEQAPQKVEPAEISLAERHAISPDGRKISLAEIALDTLHHAEQEQIMAVASYYSPVAPTPFEAQFAEVTLDIETGMVTADKLVSAVDSGIIVNPLTASGQIEGGMTQALGYALCEEMVYDEKGNARERDFSDYHIYQAHEMPDLKTIFVETFETSHPYGIKAVAEIPMDGIAPAVANAVLNASLSIEGGNGVNIHANPLTPEKVWRALKASREQSNPGG